MHIHVLVLVCMWSVDMDVCLNNQTERREGEDDRGLEREETDRERRSSKYGDGLLDPTRLDSTRSDWITCM